MGRARVQCAVLSLLLLLLSGGRFAEAICTPTCGCVCCLLGACQASTSPEPGFLNCCQLSAPLEMLGTADTTLRGWALSLAGTVAFLEPEFPVPSGQGPFDTVGSCQQRRPDRQAWLQVFRN